MRAEMLADPSGRSAEANETPAKPWRVDGWVVAFRAEGALPPLFCPCAGGGDVYDYSDLALALPEDQPVYLFGVPPLEAGETFPTVQQLAAIYVAEARKRQPHGPYRLAGHSFGGVVAFEMAVLLANDGEPVDLLALIDTLHPGFRRNMSAGERMRFRSRYIADRVAKYLGNLASGRLDRIAGDVSDFVLHGSKRAFWKIIRSVFGRLGRPPPGLIHADELVLVSAWNRYEPGIYAGRMVLLNARDRPPEYRGDTTLGWRHCATGAIDVHVVPGDHYSIMHPPHLRALVEQLEPYITAP